MAWDFENRRSLSTISGKPVALIYDGFAVWYFTSARFSVFSLNDATLDFYHDPNKFFDDYPNVPTSSAYIGVRGAEEWVVDTYYEVGHVIGTSYCIQAHTSTVANEEGAGVDGALFWKGFSGEYTDACTWDGKVYALRSSMLQDGILVYTLTDPHNPTFIPAPTGLDDKMCAANGKLWMVSKTTNADGRQTLHIYEIATGIWTSSLIPGRKQNAEPRDIIDGLDGSIYITDANSHGIHEYNHVTNAYVAFHRINRHPYKLAVNQAKTVYVTSDASGLYNGGMVSAFNQSTNTAAAFCAAGGDHEVLCDDERAGYVWMFGRGAGMMRVNKTTKDVKMLNTGVLVWSQVAQDDLPNSGSTVASDAFQPDWAEGQSYPSGTKCKSPIDGKVYVSSYTGLNAATQYDIPGVPDNAALSLWLSRQTLYQDTFATTTVDLYGQFPINLGLVIPRRSYEKWNGTGFDVVTIPEHIVVIRSHYGETPVPGYNNIMNIVRANALVRNNSTDVRGTALISVGPTDFIGDF